MQTDTIFAPSTAIGGAIAVLRISGPKAYSAVPALLRKALLPRMMTYAVIHDGNDMLDVCMAVWFPAPASYTGEDMLELHCHGGLQTIRKVSDALLQLGFRPAEGGEFTKRAFLNGKMDLTQAEAVMDIINAQADSSLRSALHQLSGGLRRRIEVIENLVLDARSALEAAIDYPDEAGEEVYTDLPQKMEDALSRINALLANAQQGRFLREGVRVVIIGKPNVGKSSLFNCLVGEDRAIVTDLAGTTRDLLDEHIAWEGVSVHLMDTAGLRKAADKAEQIGIDRAKDALQYADLLLLLFDGADGLTEEDEKLLSDTEPYKRIVVSNKSDLGTVPCDLAVSCKTGEGIDELKRRILSVVGPEIHTSSVTNMRHIRALERARAALQSAALQSEPDCIATDLREASHYLGSITGTDVDEMLLDRIFENFCVGK